MLEGLRHVTQTGHESVNAISTQSESMSPKQHHLDLMLGLLNESGRGLSWQAE